MIRTASPATVSELEREIGVLEQRLIDGERRIEEARAIGTNTEAWEEFWIELLHTYEAMCERLAAIDTDGDRLAA